MRERGRGLKPDPHHPTPSEHPLARRVPSPSSAAAGPSGACRTPFADARAPHEGSRGLEGARRARGSARSTRLRAQRAWQYHVGDRSPPPIPGPAARPPGRPRPPDGASRAASTSAAATFSPPVTITSVEAAVHARRPSGSRRPRSPVCSQPSAAIAPRSDHRARGRGSRPRAPIRGSTPGGAPRRAARGLGGRGVAICEAGLGHAVGLEERRPRPAAQASRSRGTGPPPTSAARRAGASQRQPRGGGAPSWPPTRRAWPRPEASESSTTAASKRVVDHRAGAVDRRAEQDREAGHVEERQRAQPAVVRRDAEVPRPTPGRWRWFS